MTAIDTAMQQLSAELPPDEQEILVHDVVAMKAAAEAEAAAWVLSHPDDPEGWRPAHYARVYGELDQRHPALDAWVEREHKRIENARKAFDWEHFIPMQIVARKQAEERGAKSTDTPYGRIGTREVALSKKIVIVDEKKALAYAADNCPDAIKETRTILTSKLAAAIPGTKEESTPAHKTFYLQTTAGKRHVLLGGKEEALPPPTAAGRLGADAFFGKETHDDASTEDPSEIPAP